MKMLKIVIFVVNLLIITKKLNITKFFKKLKIIVITQENLKVLHIYYANLNAQHKEIFLL